MSRFNYANVMSTLAVLLALGGTSYAATQISGRQIKDGSITGKDVKAHAIGTRQLTRGLGASYDARGQATVTPRQVCPSDSACVLPTDPKVAKLSIDLPEPANLAILSTASTRADHPEYVFAATLLDGAANGAAEGVQKIDAGSTTISYSALAHNVPAGHHVIALRASASSAATNDQLVSGSIIVIATPPS